MKKDVSEGKLIPFALALRAASARYRLTSSEIAYLYGLGMILNRPGRNYKFWPTRMRIQRKRIMRCAGITSNDGESRTRKRLIEKGLIDYARGPRGAAGTFGLTGKFWQCAKQ